MPAQHGEDLWLIARFGGIGGGYAVDVGAADGTSISNTYGLEVIGWQVLCVEPNPMFLESLARHRKLISCAAAGKENKTIEEFSIYGPAGGFGAGSSLRPDERIIATVPGLHIFGKIPVFVRTLDSLLEDVEFPRCDVVSIDTEGTEADVLRGFTPENWKTKIVIVENNFEEEETREIMRGYGFQLATRLGVNDIWERGSE